MTPQERAEVRRLELVDYLAKRHSYLTSFAEKGRAANDLKLLCSTPLWADNLPWLKTMMDRCVREHEH